ncbi:ion transport peptide-like [Trichonephila clavipes]|nr:ion transport peptide-like [Trichonephila clavipes]
MTSIAGFCLLLIGVILVVHVATSEQEMKRSFAGLGCMGVYDKAKFARLDRVCEECYQLFREPDVHTLCRTATAGSDVVQSGRPIFDDFFQHLWPYIGNNTANVVFQMVKRLWLIRIDQ